MVAASGVRVTVDINKIAAMALLVTPEAMAFVTGFAEKGASEARDNMPVHTGAERAAVISEAARLTVDGPVAYFGSTSSTWHLVEYGSIHNPPYAPFRRAAESLGIKYQPVSK